MRKPNNNKKRKKRKKKKKYEVLLDFLKLLLVCLGLLCCCVFKGFICFFVLFVVFDNFGIKLLRKGCTRNSEC